MWKKLEGFEKYYISEYGKIYSTQSKIILKTNIDKDGYERIILRKNGNKINLMIHRLVALHFVSNPDNLPQVNHKDGDKLNNYYRNFEWCDNLHNQRHKRTLYKYSSDKLYVHFNKASNKWVAQPTLNGKRIRKFFTEEQDAIDFIDSLNKQILN